MQCPYCHSPLITGALECPSCRLTFPRTCALAGAAPRLIPWIADTTGLLHGPAVARLNKQIGKIRRRFPELILQVVMHRCLPEHPFSMHAFWLFNAGNFAGNSRRGKDNHSIMILLDPFRGEAAISVGYGLEPLLSDGELDRLLAAAQPAWRECRWADGLGEVIEGLDPLLASVAVPRSTVGEAAESY